MPPAKHFESCALKQQEVKLLFAACSNPQQIYERIIQLGRDLPHYPEEFKTADRLVKGCQGQLYLYSTLENGKVYFKAHSEALISQGLAGLLLQIYSGEDPEAVLTCPPQVLDDLGIHGSLSPGRSNGLSSLFLRMKHDALKFLLVNQSL
jgi:cysteine desulfuration protein SufE